MPSLGPQVPGSHVQSGILVLGTITLRTPGLEINDISVHVRLHIKDY